MNSDPGVTFACPDPGPDHTVPNRQNFKNLKNLNVNLFKNFSIHQHSMIFFIFFMTIFCSSQWTEPDPNPDPSFTSNPDPC